MIWTRNLLIWSQTRYRCATRSQKARWCFLCRGLDAFTTKCSVISLKNPKRSGFLNFFVCSCGFQSFDSGAWGPSVCSYQQITSLHFHLMTAYQISPFAFSASYDRQSPWLFSIFEAILWQPIRSRHLHFMTANHRGPFLPWTWIAGALSPCPIAHSELFYYIFVSFFIIYLWLILAVEKPSIFAIWEFNPSR